MKMECIFLVKNRDSLQLRVNSNGSVYHRDRKHPKRNKITWEYAMEIRHTFSDTVVVVVVVVVLYKLKQN